VGGRLCGCARSQVKCLGAVHKVALQNKTTRLDCSLALSLHPNFACMHAAAHARSTAAPCLLLLAKTDDTLLAIF